MIAVNMPLWGQSLADLKRLAIEAPHPRTRERFLALSLIVEGVHNASSWAAQNDRNDETVLRWVHTYNHKGPDALTYRSTGRRAPFLSLTRPSNSLKP